MFLHRSSTATTATTAAANNKWKLRNTTIPKDKNQSPNTKSNATTATTTTNTMQCATKPLPRLRHAAVESSMVFLPCGTVIKSTPSSPPPMLKFSLHKPVATGAALVKTFGISTAEQDRDDDDDGSGENMDNDVDDAATKAVACRGRGAEHEYDEVGEAACEDDDDEEDDVYEDTEHVLPRLESKTALSLYLRQISETARLSHLDSIRSHRKKFQAARRFFDSCGQKQKPFQVVRFDLSTSTTTTTATASDDVSAQATMIPAAKKPSSTGRGWMRAMRSRVKRLYGCTAAAANSTTESPPWKGTLTPVHRSRHAPVYFVLY